MSEHLSHGTLNDLAEGLLPEGRRAAAQEHLRACGRCRGELDRLAELLDALGELPLEATPLRDLWPGVETRIGAEEKAAEVVHLYGSRDSAPPGGGRRITLSVGQLLAAGIAVAVISGSGVWLAVSGGVRAPEQGLAPGGSPPIRMAATRGAIADYEAAAGDLEQVLREGRDVLKAETVQVLEANLQTIDTAIAEARTALVRDPGSEVLYRLLAKNMKRKLDVLRSAAQAIRAAS